MASEYLQWKYRDVKPEEKPEYSPKEKRRNWLHYHKWWILLGVLLLIAAADILRGVLGLGIIRPDYQMAYVGSVPLRDETVSALQSALASLGEDCSGDGRVLFQVNSYVDMAASQDKDAARYAAAAQVRLMADMEDCESYFFLCADPEALQENYQILARQDFLISVGGVLVHDAGHGVHGFLAGAEIQKQFYVVVFRGRRVQNAHTRITI